MELKELIKKLAQKLNEKGVDYMVVGGQALLLYGEPRLTKDIDIILGVRVGELQKVIEITKQLDLKPIPDKIEEFVKKTMVLPVIDPKSGLRVDFIFSWTPYEREALKRVNRVKIDDVLVKYASVEDLIIQKIVAGRPRDLEDVKSVLLKNKNIDEAYVLKWLKIFGETLEEDLIRRFEEVRQEIKK